MQVTCRYIFLIVATTLCCLQAGARKSYTVSSPDGNIIYTASIVNNTFYYRVSYKRKAVIDNSPVTLLFKETDFASNIAVQKVQFTEGSEDYTLIVGKAKHVTDRYKQLVIHLQQLQSPFLQLNITIRVFNDGLAFQYQLPKWQNYTEFTLLQENTSFNITGNPLVRTLLFDNYTLSHEGVYKKIPLAELPTNQLVDLPALFERNDNIYISIAEAALVDYAGMYLTRKDNCLVSKLSPWPNDTTIKVKSSLPHKSPWRVMLISDKVGDLIESNIITSLNEPCKIENTSWIKPGKTTFPWWNGNVLPDTINAPGNNFVTQQYYIDFCARNNIQYHSVVEYGLHQWYVDDGTGFQPGPNADVTKPVPGLNMKEVCDYAHSKNVDVRVWVHWAALYPKLDTAFTLFEKWGLSGMMVDFMDRDDQQMVNMQNEILEKGAKHKLHIQFHGAYKPTGLHRTWPNEFTREGTLNYEANKWGVYITPDMDIDIPFTRMLAGSTDYHLGGFRAMPASKMKPNYTRPFMLGTRCHMLAMYVVLENYLQMVCDYPEAYEGQPGFEFIKNVPTVWDETKVIDAKPGEFIVIARKKDNNWYVGAITNSHARNLEIAFSFLGEGHFDTELYSDADDVAVNPNHLNKEMLQLNSNSKLNLKLSAGGGAVIQLLRNK
jgi:alpha-glucosidase